MNKFEIDSDKVYETLVAGSKAVKSLDIDSRNLKPCIASIIESGLEKGSLPDRSTGALIITSELRRLGKDRKFTLDFLRNWNKKNRPLKRESEIRSAVKSGFGKEYRYSCQNVNLQQFCIGKDFCQFAKVTSQSGKYTNNRKFLEFGWQNLLSNVAKDLYYLAIIELERRLTVGPGGIVIANHKRFAELAGITVKSVGKALLELSRTPLIKHFEMGTPRKWEVKATEIQRTIPIPRPPKRLLKKREK